MKSTFSNPVTPIASPHTDELHRRTNQLWIGIWIANILVLASTFIIRRLTGNSISPPAIVLQSALNGLVLANLLLINTRYARIAQGIYVFAIHLAVPPVLVLYGGTRGFGDIAVYMAILLALLYGWQPWMFFTYSSMGAALIWVLYQDSTGNPVAPLLDYSAQFTALKFVITAFILVFALRYISTFYRGLLETYRAFTEELLRLNNELKLSEQALAQSNKNLILSRQSIVTVREEERRRLRRDLHDGLGPTLAAQVFRVGVARQMAAKDPERTAAILADVETGIDTTLVDVRRLVYGLRPPLLDQFGLLGAMRDVAAQQAGQLEMRLDLPPRLPHLSAAVEVAIFSIFQTALDNVVKHARAQRCAIQLRAVEEAIMLSVVDDGIGIHNHQLFGVGLTAMKERAEELGGTFDIRCDDPHGTRVNVQIPLPASPESEGS